MCDNCSSLQILRKFVCYFWSKYVTSIQAYTYYVNLCANFTQNVINIQACTNLCVTFKQNMYSSLHIFCKFVCYAKSVINIQVYTYYMNLCATFTKTMWFTYKYSSLHILCKFVCFFYAKCVIYALLSRIRPF